MGTLHLLIRWKKGAFPAGAQKRIMRITSHACIDCSQHPMFALFWDHVEEQKEGYWIQDKTNSNLLFRKREKYVYIFAISIRGY